MSKKELVLMHHPEKLKPQDGNFDYGWFLLQYTGLLMYW
jgi:hypothetical protein